MKSLIVGDKPTVQRLAERLKRASSHSEYQRHSFSARRPAGCCWWTTCSRPIASAVASRWHARRPTGCSSVTAGARWFRGPGIRRQTLRRRPPLKKRHRTVERKYLYSAGLAVRPRLVGALRADGHCRMAGLVQAWGSWRRFGAGDLCRAALRPLGNNIHTMQLATATVMANRSAAPNLLRDDL